MGELCQGGLCTPGCINSDRCPVGTRCINNFCQEGLGCNGNDDCANGQVCDLSSGECVVGECSIDANCPSGFACVNFTCQDASQCDVSEECPEGQLCLGGRCTESDRCDPSVDLINLTLQSIGDAEIIDVDTTDEDNRFQASCGGGGSSSEKVIEVQINTIGQLTVTVESAPNFDTVLFMRSRCEVEGSQIACNDDANELLSEISTPILTPGIYYVFLDGFGSNTGIATLRFSLTSLTECVSDRDCDGGPCIDGICAAPECVADFDCPEGLVCNNGTCIEGFRCFADRDCPETEICENRTCIPGECLEDIDCGVRLICDEFRCSRPECRVDNDCARGQACDQGRCIEFCRVDADCGDAFSICEANSCVSAECIRDDQCGPGESCEQGRCVTGGGGGGTGVIGDSCVNDTSCNGELICEGEVCESAEGLCAEVTDCDGSGACLGGNCVPSPTCQTADDCSGAIPIPIPLLCINNQCRSAFVQCTLNRDCGSGQSCAFGICIPLPANECLRDSDCGNGRLCEGGSCQ